MGKKLPIKSNLICMGRCNFLKERTIIVRIKKKYCRRKRCKDQRFSAYPVPPSITIAGNRPVISLQVRLTFYHKRKIFNTRSKLLTLLGLSLESAHR